MAERYGNEVELRATGRQLSGVAVPYGETADVSRAMRQYAGGRRERFASGSLAAQAATVALNLEHRFREAIAWHPGGGLEFRETDAGLRFATGELPGIEAADLALDGVRSGKYRGVSLEFRALNERQEGGTRLITQYELQGLALARVPVYSGAGVEARQMETAAVRATIEADGGRIYDCDCVGGRGSEVCRVRFEAGAFDEALRRVEAARETAQRPPVPTMPIDVPPAIGPRTPTPPRTLPDLPAVPPVNVVAHIGSFSPGSVLADTNNGGLTLALVGNILNIGLEPRALETEAGVELLRAAEVADVHARPLIDMERSEFEDVGDVRTYYNVWLQSILFKTALRPFGWLPVEIAAATADPFVNLLPTAETVML